MPVPEEAALFVGIDHVSLTVVDLDPAVDFYCGVVGAELLYRMGPFDSRELPRTESGQDWSAARVGVSGARISIAMLRIASTLKMELLQYDQPVDACRTPPRNCDAGSRHLCLEVADLERAVRYLEMRGCKPAAAPIIVPAGDWPGSRNWYVQDPFGHQLELVQFQNLN